MLIKYIAISLNDKIVIKIKLVIRLYQITYYLDKKDNILSS